MSSPKKISVRNAVLITVFVSLIFGSGAMYAGILIAPNLASLSNQTITITSPLSGSGTMTQKIFVAEEEATIAAVKKVQSAVVSIVIKKNLNQLYQERNQNFFFIDPLTGRRIQSTPAPSANGDQEKEIGGGTGFIVSGDGYVITNKHVVSDKGATYSVFLSDGTEYKGQLLDTDPINDLAILKIDGKNLPTVTLGDSSDIQVGATVLAIGNSLNEYRQTVSKGIISGMNRSITASDSNGSGVEQLDGIIQTDAAINPGNSGGPLVNLSGEVIGINTAIDQSGQLIGFALPINDAKFIVDSVKAYGRVIRPQLGVRYMMITKPVAKANQLPVEYGALVVRGEKASELAVIPGSPADKAGLVENDIILEINGQKLDEKNQLAKIIQNFKPGDTVSLKIFHKGEEKTVAVTLTELNKSDTTSTTEPSNNQ